MSTDKHQIIDPMGGTTCVHCGVKDGLHKGTCPMRNPHHIQKDGNMVIMFYHPGFRNPNIPGACTDCGGRL